MKNLAIFCHRKFPDEYLKTRMDDDKGQVVLTELMAVDAGRLGANIVEMKPGKMSYDCSPYATNAATVQLQTLQETLIRRATQAEQQVSSTSQNDGPEVMCAESTTPEEPSRAPAQSSAPMLPPCRICEEKASGFHYGANTCEACKGFFRRCLNRKEQYKCVADGRCEVTSAKRSVCSYCRWKKCIDAGMSKNAIKTGRYTHEKKTRDIREVKRLQQIEKRKAEGATVVEEDSVSEAELDQLIRHITDVHRQYTPHTPEFFAKLPEKEKQFLEQRELQQKMFGTMRAIPREEYLQIYQTTGIDVDGRREIIKHMIPCIEKSIKRFIAFAKALPGFKELPIDDQISLIKASRLETWLISMHQAFNRDAGLFTDVCGYTLDMAELVKVHQREHLESIFLVAHKMRALALTQEEVCVFRAICILQSDRAKLVCPAQVDRSQNLVIAAMQLLARRNHSHVRLFLPKLIDIMVEMRTLTELHRQWEETINMDWSSEFTIPPLLIEMASV